MDYFPHNFAITAPSLFAAAAGANEAGAVANRTTAVPLLDCDGVPCIEVPFGQGSAGTAIIDSDDVASLVDVADEQVAQESPLRFPAPGVHEPDGMFDGTVGLLALRDKIVTIDFHDLTSSIATSAG